jgi:hypothetical protein
MCWKNGSHCKYQEFSQNQADKNIQCLPPASKAHDEQNMQKYMGQG